MRLQKSLFCRRSWRLTVDGWSRWDAWQKNQGVRTILSSDQNQHFEFLHVRLTKINRQPSTFNFFLHNQRSTVNCQHSSYLYLLKIQFFHTLPIRLCLLFSQLLKPCHLSQGIKLPVHHFQAAGIPELDKGFTRQVFQLTLTDSIQTTIPFWPCTATYWTIACKYCLTLSWSGIVSNKSYISKGR